MAIDCFTLMINGIGMLSTEINSSNLITQAKLSLSSYIGNVEISSSSSSFLPFYTN